MTKIQVIDRLVSTFFQKQITNVNIHKLKEGGQTKVQITIESTMHSLQQQNIFPELEWAR